MGDILIDLTWGCRAVAGLWDWADRSSNLHPIHSSGPRSQRTGLSRCRCGAMYPSSTSALTGRSTHRQTPPADNSDLSPSARSAHSAALPASGVAYETLTRSPYLAQPMQTIMEAVFELIARRQRARCADRRGALSRTIAALADEMKLPLTGIAIIVLAPWAIYRAQTPTLERVICEAING